MKLGFLILLIVPILFVIFQNCASDLPPDMSKDDNPSIQAIDGGDYFVTITGDTTVLENSTAMNITGDCSNGNYEYSEVSVTITDQSSAVLGFKDKIPCPGPFSEYIILSSAIRMTMSSLKISAEITPFDAENKPLSNDVKYSSINVSIQQVIDTSVTISNQPAANLTVTYEGTITLIVGAVSGDQSFSYQWRKYESGVATNLGGQTTSTLTINNALPDDHAGEYDVVVSNSSGNSATSEKSVVTVNERVPGSIGTPVAGDNNYNYNARSYYFNGTNAYCMHYILIPEYTQVNYQQALYISSYAYHGICGGGGPGTPILD